MRATGWALGLAVLAAATAGGADGPAYDLRGPGPQVGRTTTARTTFRVKDGTLTVKLMGQVVDAAMAQTSTDVEELKVLAVDGRRVTKAQIRVLKQRVEAAGSVLGMGVTEKRGLPLEGEVILAERTGSGAWKHTLVDTKPDQKQRRQLERRYGPDGDDEFFPAEKVKVGHTWAAPALALRRPFGESIGDLDGKLRATFVRVEAVNGEDCAVVEFAGVAKGVTRQDEGELDAEVDLKLTTWRSLRTGLPVKDRAEGKLKASGPLEVQGVKVDVTIEGPFTLELSTEAK